MVFTLALHIYNIMYEYWKYCLTWKGILMTISLKKLQHFYLSSSKSICRQFYKWCLYTGTGVNTALLNKLFIQHVSVLVNIITKNKPKRLPVLSTEHLPPFLHVMPVVYRGEYCTAVQTVYTTYLYTGWYNSYNKPTRLITCSLHRAFAAVFTRDACEATADKN